MKTVIMFISLPAKSAMRKATMIIAHCPPTRAGFSGFNLRKAVVPPDRHKRFIL